MPASSVRNLTSLESLPTRLRASDRRREVRRVLPVLILALFTTGRNRTAGLLGLLRVAMRLHQSPLISLDDFLILFPVEVFGFGLLAFRPRSIRPAGRYLWPIPTAMWAFYWLPLLGQHSGIGG